MFNQETTLDLLDFFCRSKIKTRALKDIFKTPQEIITNLFKIKLIKNKDILQQIDLVINKEIYIKGEYQGLYKKGSYGDIYLAKDKNNPQQEYIIKINIYKKDFSKSSHLNEVIYEIGYYYLLDKIGIGPKLYNNSPFIIDIYNGYYLINQKRYTSDLNDFYKIHRNQATINFIEMKIHNCVDKILELGLLVFDLKPPNILLDYNQDGIISDLVLTDFCDKWCLKTSIIDKQLLDLNKEFLKLYIILPIIVLSLLVGVKIFPYEVRQLDKLVNQKKTKIFLKYILQDKEISSKIYPTIYYLVKYFKIANFKYKLISINRKNPSKCVITLIKKFTLHYKKN